MTELKTGMQDAADSTGRLDPEDDQPGTLDSDAAAVEYPSTDGQANDRQEGKRATLSATALVLLFIGTFVCTGAVFVWESWWLLIVSVALVVAAGFTYRTYREISMAVYLRPSPMSQSIEVYSDTLDGDEEEALDGNLSSYIEHPSPGDFLLQMIVDSSPVVSRITETVEPFLRSIQVKTTISIPQSRLPNEGFAIPVMMAPRGRLVDGLKATTQDGTRVSTMPSSDVQGLILAALRDLVSELGRKRLNRYIGEVEPSLSIALASTEPWSDETVARLLDQIFEALPSASSRLGKHDYSGLDIAVIVVAAVLRLRYSYPICVFVGRDNPRRFLSRLSQERSVHSRETFRVMVERRVVPRFRTRASAGSFTSRARDNTRRLLAVRSSVVYYNLSQADLSESYHLHAKGPAGTYFARAELVRDLDASQDSDAPEAELFRESSRQGQRHVHVYVRGGLRFSGWVAGFNFYERLPGSVGGALLSAVVAFSVIVTAASQQLSGSGASSELLAVLLTVPTALAVWSGFEGGSQIRSVSLVSRASSIITLAVSFSAAMVFAFWRLPGDAAMPLSPPDEYRLVIWGLVLSLSFVNMIGIFCSWWLRATVEGRIIDSMEAEVLQ